MGISDAGDRSSQFDLGYYGQQFLQTMSSVYPGYHATRSIAEVVIGTIYGTVDGLIGGAVFAWLYNQFARPGA